MLLPLRGEERKCWKLTGSSLVVFTADAVGLLDGEAATEWTGDGGVAAAYSADVTGGGTDAVEVIRHLDVDGEVLSLGLRETVLAGDVVGDFELDEVGGCVGSLVKVTLVRTSAIGVDLVDGHGDGRAPLYGGDCVGLDCLLSLTADIDVALELSASARVDDVLGDLTVTDDSGV